MKIKVPTTVEKDVKVIRLALPVEYDEEEIPNDFPGRNGKLLEMSIEVDTGKIINWPAGRVESVHLTVKDAGTYELLDESGQRVAIIEQNYVPHCIIPGSFGDTVEITIESDGRISNWPKPPTFEKFFPGKGDDE